MRQKERRMIGTVVLVIFSCAEKTGPLEKKKELYDTLFCTRKKKRHATLSFGNDIKIGCKVVN